MLSNWMSSHRALTFAVLSAGIWIFANYWYLRTDITRWRRLNKPHKWSVDMATKGSKGGKNKASH